MPSFRRNRRVRADKDKPEVVTGSFELHYEEVVHRHRVVLIALFTTGLVLVATFIPSAVYHSIADTDKVSIEVEKGLFINSDRIQKIEGDITASDNAYIEFKVLEKSNKNQ